VSPRVPRDTVTTHDCGWSSKRTTAGLAKHALRLHSCQRQANIDARLARGDAQRAAINRTPKPCLHKHANHQHGTYACYVLDECRCLPCALANSTYEQRRLRQIAYGRADRLVDAGPVRAHVRALMAEGMGLKRVQKVSGVSQGALWKLIYGKRQADGTQRPARRVTRVNANKLLAVHADMSTLAGGAFISPIGTRRRLRALVAIGWSQTKLGERIGMGPGNFCSMLQRDQISVRTARAVAELYEQLWNTQPPEATHRDKIAASRARNYAAANSWPPPLAWDDDTIDDPAAEPMLDAEASDELDEAMVLRIMTGTLQLARSTKTIPERVEAIRRFAAGGLTDAVIGERIGMSPAAVCKDRIRHNIAAGVPSGRRTA
jgi:hypothetical protein